MKTRFNGILLGVALLASACGNAQREAFEKTLQVERQAAAEHLAAVKPEYEKVIRMDPASKWAEQARARLEIVEAKLHAQQKTEELNQSVFHQTGID